jgi:CDGSH iron-sulfur domain-containing protein 3
MTQETKIATLDNGPFLVTGSVLITDGEGNQFHSERETIALCRCGGSTTRPFCDGTHSKLGFQAAERAVQQESQL